MDHVQDHQCPEAQSYERRVKKLRHPKLNQQNYIYLLIGTASWLPITGKTAVSFEY